MTAQEKIQKVTEISQSKGWSISVDYDELQMKFMGLESRKDEYMNRTRTENETKDYYSEVNETKRRLDRAQAQLSKAGANDRG